MKLLEEEADAREDRRREQQRLDERPAPTQRGFVYLLRDATRGHLKIGRSIDPTRRLQALARAQSVPPELVASTEVADAKGVELDLHRRFAHLRLNGEWFHASEEIEHAFTTLVPDETHT